MKFDIIEVFNRSVTIEFQNQDPYETNCDCMILINGEERCTTRQNVVSIDGLLPESEYCIEVRAEAETERQSFKTKTETVLLDVKEFGAAGDGKKDDTAAIQAAICSCPKNGTVRLSKGIYYSKPLFLKSHISLWIEKGATLLGNKDRTKYPILPGIVRASDHENAEYNLATWEGNPLSSFASLITGIDVEQVDIYGQGTIDGNGAAGDWWQDPKKKRIAWRPNTVFFNHCRNIRMQGVTVQNSPSWTVHPYYCDDISFVNLMIRNPSDSPNTDGFDPESCTNVKLLGTTISVGDDCVAIKSGKMYMGHVHYRRTKNVVVRNCRLERGHGSVTVGSEVASGVEDVRVSRCVFSKTDRGLRIKTRRGRGHMSVLDRIVFENVTMDKVPMPFTINMFYFCDPDGHSEYVQTQETLPVDQRTPQIGTIQIRNVTCTDVNASVVCAYGLPEMPIGCIDMENVTASFLPMEEQSATCPIMMDHFDSFSGKSFYIRNVEQFRAKNVVICGASDEKPELICVGEGKAEISYQSVSSLTGARRKKDYYASV